MFLPELIHSEVSDDCIGELFDRWRHSSRVQSDGTLYAVNSKHLSVLLHSWEGTTKHWLLYSYQLTVTTYNIILSSHSVTNSFPPKEHIFITLSVLSFILNTFSKMLARTFSVNFTWTIFRKSQRVNQTPSDKFLTCSAPQLVRSLQMVWH